jgi:hypothetical protein
MAVGLAVLAGLVAFAVDLGQVVLVRTQLQAAVDKAALEGVAALRDGRRAVYRRASRCANQFAASGQPITLRIADVELGAWDMGSRSFVPRGSGGNAVRVTARRSGAPLLFARWIGCGKFDAQASAVAVSNPRDILFVVDLSGSMNDDTEPTWATAAIDGKHADHAPDVGSRLMHDLFADFGFGEFPGVLQHVGENLPGVPADDWAYAEMTKDDGPLARPFVDARYRIVSSDDESARKLKAYRWIIDTQIASQMPQGRPVPNSSDAASYRYWEKYLDYVIPSGTLVPAFGSGNAQPGTPPLQRGTIPPGQDPQIKLHRFNNPNKSSYPQTRSTATKAFRNKVGYATYVAFMMDFGRDDQPIAGVPTPLSTKSPHCPLHSESTAGGLFRFPPREQPTHATRRALIGAIERIRQQNRSIPLPAARDWVGIVTFDHLTQGPPILQQALTADYAAAQQACTRLQAVGDRNAYSSATEAGLIAAYLHVKPPVQGGAGRPQAAKIIVLVTDGLPNVHSTAASTIDAYIADHSSRDWYGEGYYWLDAPLRQAHRMRAGGVELHAVGIGPGVDYGFLDRLARMAGTADSRGLAPRGSDNPADYEAKLQETLERILSAPRSRLVD